MSTKAILGVFAVVAVIQLGVPASMLWRHENVLRTGTPYKFRTAPVDPYDAFRGRYVALNYADTHAPVRPGDELRYREPAYVSLEKDTAGFARFVELSAAPPATGDYLRVEYHWGVGGTNAAHFRLPFDRYYMEESKAPRAEQAYWRQGNRRGQTNDATYVMVRVKGGRGVIEELFIQDKPVRQFLAEEATH
jgi:uncharacterized membrane-anchored protein